MQEMKYISTRTGIEATSAETVFQGLAPDGGLFVPQTVPVVFDAAKLSAITTIREAEEAVMGALFDDLPADWVCPLCGVGKDEFAPE